MKCKTSSNRSSFLGSSRVFNASFGSFLKASSLGAKSVFLMPVSSDKLNPSAVLSNNFNSEISLAFPNYSTNGLASAGSAA